MICTKCLIEKDETEFSKKRRSCIECERERGREYRRTTTKAKEWTEKNRERMSELQHDWYDKNKKEIRERESLRYQSDPLFKEIRRHRSVLRRLIKGKSQTSSLVNFDATRLQNWISYQFDDNMTMSNHGTYWTIDHVIPLNELQQGRLSSDVIFHWYNIRPVVKALNLKRNKYASEVELETHIETIKLYVKTKNLDLDDNYISVIQIFLRHISEREPPKASDTTSIEKSLEGTRLIAEANSNNSEDELIIISEMDNPQ